MAKQCRLRSLHFTAVNGSMSIVKNKTFSCCYLKSVNEVLMYYWHLIFYIDGRIFVCVKFNEICRYTNIIPFGKSKLNVFYVDNHLF